MATATSASASSDWLQQRLSASIDPQLALDGDARRALDAELEAASCRPGYGIALVEISANRSIDDGVRQLAAVLLKAFVKKHWDEAADGFVAPPASEAEKATLRASLPSLLSDPNRKVRTAVGMAVAAIAASDWPEKWPDLMSTHLLPAVGNAANPDAVSGAIRCLALISDDISDDQVVTIAAQLLPAALLVASTPAQFDSSVRRRAFYIFHSLVASLGVMSAAYQKECRDLIAPSLPDWMKLFAATLAQPFPQDDPPEWGIRMEILRCLTQIIQNFPSLAQSLLPEPLAALWQAYVSGIAVFEKAAVLGEGEAGEGAVDEDGGDESLVALCIQEFEFLISLVANPRFQQFIGSSLEPLVYFAISYMQMTAAEEEEWSGDLNKFVEDEENEALSCRTSGALLLEELSLRFEQAALQGVAAAVQRRLNETAAMKAEGRRNWWKVREAAIFAAGTLAENFLQSEQSGPPLLNCPAFLSMLLAQDLGPGGAVEFPFLFGRCLWAAARFTPESSPEASRQLLPIAVQSMSHESPPIVQIGAVRCLARLLPVLSADDLRPFLPSIYDSVGVLLGKVSEETLHLVLDLLETLVRADPESAAKMEAAVSTALFSIWEANVTDPVISCDASDVLEALADCPGCIDSLVAKAIPPMHAIFSKPQEQSDGMVEGAMDLLTMLIKRSSVASLKAIFDGTFPAVAAIMMQTDDHTQLQNGVELLSALVQKGGDSLLGWSSDPTATLKSLMDVAARLLSPDLEPSAALFVGPLLVAILRRFPDQVAPHQQAILAAVVRRMAEKSIPSLSTSLLLVIARIVHLNSSNVGQLIEGLAHLPLAGHPNSLVFVLQEWAKYHEDIYGSFQQKVASSALVLLLAANHPLLSSINVQGKLIATPASSSTPVTRSKSRVVADNWSQVPFPAKALSIFASILAEGSAGKEPILDADEALDDDDDEEGEEDDDEDGEDQIPSAEAKSLGFSGLLGIGSKSQFASAELFAHYIEQDMAPDVFGEDDDDEDVQGDPLNNIDLKRYIKEFLNKWLKAEGSPGQVQLQHLDSEDRTALALS